RAVRRTAGDTGGALAGTPPLVTRVWMKQGSSDLPCQPTAPHEPSRDPSQGPEIGAAVREGIMERDSRDTAKDDGNDGERHAVRHEAGPRRTHDSMSWDPQDIQGHNRGVRDETTYGDQSWLAPALYVRREQPIQTPNRHRGNHDPECWNSE